VSDAAGSRTAYRLAAPAKLNLSLAVTGRRADGLHELAGVMVLLELADDQTLAAGSGDLTVKGSGEHLPRGRDDNLAWRGLAAALGADAKSWSLTLDKRIPVRAGLGGGSSDAAAAWRLGRCAANRDDRATADDLGELAAIGADVPFFAARTAAAWVTGIGEAVHPLRMPANLPGEVVLVHPPFGLSTAAVFAELRPNEWSPSPSVPANLQDALAAGNDLLDPARRLRPEINDIARLVLSAGAEPRMTGSGPTLFALVDDKDHADAIAQRLGRAGLITSRTRLRTEPASIGLEEVRT
jgi:4-diphosphocytidyl-2-C-methyl-D-erythritol kinase